MKKKFDLMRLDHLWNKMRATSLMYGGVDKKDMKEYLILQINYMNERGNK